MERLYTIAHTHAYICSHTHTPTFSEIWEGQTSANPNFYMSHIACHVRDDYFAVCSLSLSFSLYTHTHQYTDIRLHVFSHIHGYNYFQHTQITNTHIHIHLCTSISTLFVMFLSGNLNSQYMGRDISESKALERSLIQSRDELERKVSACTACVYLCARVCVCVCIFEHCFPLFHVPTSYVF